MNADLTLAHLAEVAATHDDHAHDGDRHCLLSGAVAGIHEAAAVSAEPLDAGVSGPARPCSAQPDALSATVTRWPPGQAWPGARTARKPRR
jgi:hypothetical protein